MSRESVEDYLKEKACWVRRETIKIHKSAPETRLASSMSDIEIFVSLYYGKILSFDPKNPRWEARDRFVVSKGHGSVSLYPILADLGFFDLSELKNVCKPGSFLGSIPDKIPGFETINGSLGHGLGVALGIATALSAKKNYSMVFVLVGDGEMCEGSIWEAIMLAGQRQASNLILIIDKNAISMLDYMDNIINLDCLEKVFNNFGWKTETVNGHEIEDVYMSLKRLKNDKTNQPKVLIAKTIKGKGVPILENDYLCHVKSLKPHECDMLLRKRNKK